MNGKVAIGRAGADRAEAVSALLRATAGWLKDRGEPLWTEDVFDARAIANQAECGQVIVAQDEAAIVGCMFVEDSDLVFWPDKHSERSLYLHKIAVARSHAGTGIPRAFVQWAKAEALLRGAIAIRLDCDPRPQLLTIYRALGFRDVGDFKADGFLVRRFEMHCH